MNKLLTTLMLTLPILSAQAAEVPRPEFNEKRQFFVGSAQGALPLAQVPVESYVFSAALPKCQETAQNIESYLAQNTSAESSYISAVRSLFPDFKISWLHGLRLLIDDFGNMVSAFRSFYLPPQQNLPAMISLDCSQSSRLSWPALLSHETVHHLNHDRHLAPWIDEMLAQVVEVRAAAAYPTPRFESLRTRVLVPSFFARDKVFTSSPQYAVNMLFGLYISQNFGGARLFPSLTQNVQTLSDLAKLVRTSTEGQNQFDWIRNYVTPRGLIRHFNLALNINLPTLNQGSIYQVPGWYGFEVSTEVQKPGRYYIEPGGSLRISKKWAEDFSDHDKNSSWDVYRILKNGMTFKIQDSNEPVSGDWDQNYLMIINGSESDYFQVDLP